MGVVAAGVNEAHTGHHHILVDTGLPDLGLPIKCELYSFRRCEHVDRTDAGTRRAHTAVIARGSPAYPARSARNV
jgi:hypothetical protein